MFNEQPRINNQTSSNHPRCWLPETGTKTGGVRGNADAWRFKRCKQGTGALVWNGTSSIICYLFDEIFHFKLNYINQVTIISTVSKLQMCLQPTTLFGPRMVYGKTGGTYPIALQHSCNQSTCYAKLNWTDSARNAQMWLPAVSYEFIWTGFNLVCFTAFSLELPWTFVLELVWTQRLTLTLSISDIYSV